MDVFQIDEEGRFFISPDIDDWCPVEERAITAVFDFDNDLDISVPEVPNQLLYIYLPFEDRDLPDLQRLHVVAQMGARLLQDGHKILLHCGMGHNRCALVAGVMLTYLGYSGKDAVALIRQRRQGALYNQVFACYLDGLPPVGEQPLVGLLRSATT